jgi:hypothetical protein
MEAVKKARLRLQKYPLYLADCSGPASTYAKCVQLDLNVKHKACEKEFLVFMDCVRKSSQKRGGRF